MNTKLSILAVLLAGAATSAHAAGNASPLPGCTELGADREVVRAGSTTSMALRDGDSHYLLTFRGDCGSLATTNTLKIVAEGAENRLCPSDTVVRTRRDDCKVARVEEISAEQFAVRKRRAR